MPVKSWVSYSGSTPNAWESVYRLILHFYIMLVRLSSACVWVRAYVCEFVCIRLINSVCMCVWVNVSMCVLIHMSSHFNDIVSTPTLDRYDCMNFFYHKHFKERDTISSDKVCQMLTWWTKNSLHSINIWDTFTNMVPWCSVYKAPFIESNLTLLAPFPTQLAYLSMLYILEIVCNACSADHLKNK